MWEVKYHHYEKDHRRHLRGLRNQSHLRKQGKKWGRKGWPGISLVWWVLTGISGQGRMAKTGPLTEPTLDPTSCD